MRTLRAFPRVWILWGHWWALQFAPGPYISLGFHLDPRRPLLDLHLAWVTIAIGPEAHITGQQDRHRQSCRGFLFSDNLRL
jgi:hypothetical protein